MFDYDVDKAALIGPAPLAARFAADVCSRHKNFGLIVDLSHIPITHENTRFVIRTLGRISRISTTETRSRTPTATATATSTRASAILTVPTTRRSFWTSLRILREEGFFNAEDPYILSAEVTLRPGEDEQIVLANTKRVLNRAWALLED